MKKKILLAICFLFAFASNALAINYWVDTNGYIHTPGLVGILGQNDTVSRYSSLTAAISSIGSTSTQLFVDRPTTLTGNTTIPSNVGIYVTKTGLISLGTYTLSFASGSSFDAGNYQAISLGTGHLSFAYGTIQSLNALWLGVDPTFTNDSSNAIQQSINVSAGVSPVDFPCGHFKHSSPIYLNYDSSLNPYFPSDPYKNILAIRGCLVEGRGSADASKYNGTLFEYTGTSGPGIIRDKDASFTGYEGVNFHMTNMGFKSGAPDYVISAHWTHSHSFIDDLFVQQTNTLGSLMDIQETYMITGNRWFLYGPAYPAKAQIGLKIYNQSAGGGLYDLNMITSRNTNTCYEIGGLTYGDGIANAITNFNFFGQAGDCNIGMYVGWRVMTGNIKLYTESTGTVQNSIVVDNQPQNLTISDGWFAAHTSGAQIYAGQTVGLNIERNFIYVPDYSLSSGITLSSSAGTDTYRVSKNTFWPLTTPHTNTTGIDLEGTHGDTKIYGDNVFVSLDTKVKNIQFANPTIQSITVTASPFTQSNSTMEPMEVTVQGGTVTSIAVVRRGVTVTTGLTNGMFRLDPLDSLVTTYTGTPTMKYWNHSY